MDILSLVFRPRLFNSHHFSLCQYHARKHVWILVERQSVVAFANFPNELITGRGSVRASNFGRAVHAKGDVSTREERRGWEHWSVLLRSINGAVIRECINNFGIINSRIILRERSWLETLPAALPRKQDYILYRVRLCLHKDATWTYHGLGIGKRIVDQSNNFPFLYFLFFFSFVREEFWFCIFVLIVKEVSIYLYVFSFFHFFVLCLWDKLWCFNIVLIIGWIESCIHYTSFLFYAFRSLLRQIFLFLS